MTDDPMLNPDYKNSIARYVGDGVKTSWDINFSGGYIRREHVKAYKQSSTGATEPVSFSWVGPTTVSIIPAIPLGTSLVIYRDTPKDLPLVDFTDGAILDETDLDTMAKQSVMVAAEIMDRFVEVSDAADQGLAASAASLAAAETATVLSEAAAADSAEALSKATTVEAGFGDLLATVQDLSGQDLSALARLDRPQTFTERQVFVSTSIENGNDGIEFSPTGQYRFKSSSGWGSWRDLGTWEAITNKPTSYPPSQHTHTWDAIASKPLTFPPSNHTHSWDDVQGKPTTFPPVAHTHSWNSIENKPDVAVKGQAANFLTLSLDGVNMVRTFVQSAAPTAPKPGDLWVW